ncbi:MAG TPA: LysE family transporter [Cyclobacteriaceae bacterium]|nr:LysE family transporter [Cyclobacteriaceae bacterium]
MDILLKGILFGLVLALLVGPVFFTLIQTSIERGFIKAFFVAIGVSLSDLFYISIIYLGLSKIMEGNQAQQYMGLTGGFILIGFGLYYAIFKNRQAPQELVNVPVNKNYLRYVLKGFVINGLSPFVLIFWIGAVGLASTEFVYNNNELIFFFSIVVLTVFTTDILKIWLAGFLRNLITPQSLRIINISVGFVLFIFGCRLLWWSFS